MTEVEKALHKLYRIRKQNRLSQRDVARRMKVVQPYIVQIEKAESDYHISTLMRYARACGGRLRLIVERDEEIAGCPLTGQE